MLNLIYFIDELTEECVKYIRSSSATQRSLAKKYGVAFQTINDVKLNKTWKHVL